MAKDKKGGGRSRDTVTREYTINLHKKLHNTNCALHDRLSVCVSSVVLPPPPAGRAMP